VQEQNPTAPRSDAQPLAPNTALKGYLETGATRVYSLQLEAQQVARVVVKQKGVDAVVKVYRPDSSLYREVDNPNGLYGPETVTILAHTTTIFKIEVKAGVAVPGGGYDLTIEGPRTISPDDEKRVEAETIFAEAQELRYAKNYKVAVQRYEEAIALWRELNCKQEEGYSLTNEGRVYRVLSEPSPALDRLAEALLRLQEAGDNSGQAFTLNEIGAVHINFGDAQDAIAAYGKALELRVELHDRYGQAQLYNNLGLAYSYIGYQPQAAENLETSSGIWRELHSLDNEMNTLVNAAKAHAEMGDLKEAFSQYYTVLKYCDQYFNSTSPVLKRSANFLKPYALNGLGLVYDTWIDADEAGAKYKEALDLFHNNGDEKAEADVLDNLGLLHAFLGDVLHALEYFNSALVIRERRKELKGWGVTLSNIGLTYTLLGKHKEALQQLELALPLCQRARDKRFEAYTLVRMGMAYVAMNDPSKALESYKKALEIQQDPALADQRGQAITLDKMGEALALSGKPVQALEAYGNAVQRWIAVGDDQGRALSLYGIARIERNRPNLANARDRIDEAIKLVEKVRNKVTARQLQMIYFAGKQDLYALAIDVRMQLYERTKSNADLEAAVSLSEQSRARNLIDLLAAAHVDLSKSMSSAEAEKNIKLQRQINELTQSHLRLLSIKAKKDATVVFDTLKSRIQEQDDLLTSVARRGSAGGNQSAHLLTPHEIQQLLDDKTMVLEFSLGEERSHLWTITQSNINYYGLPAGPEIEKAANKLSQALIAYEQKRRPNESDAEFTNRLRLKPDYYLSSALDLSHMVLGEVWPQLGNKRLVIVADGALQYIPFEVLPSPASSLDGGGSIPPLVAKNEVVYQPSASALGLLRGVARPNLSKTVAVFADPVFSDDDDRVQPTQKSQSRKAVVNRSREKLTSSLRDVGDDDFTLSKLAYSLKEANGITALAPRGSWMKKVGFDANREAATSPSLKQFSIVHFATHGIVNDKQPELSGIVLSLVNKRGQDQDGYLTLHDIYYLDLPIRLVVVSACRTGIGKQVPGEGLIALTRGFMHAGAQGVVVSLWDVDDEATAEFMTRFYEQMLGKNKLSPAAALRQAKSEMQVHANERWRAPYYWAGFVLQGDWK
jgi:CHAT domain-containing protein/predicted negative regulator of RcsB-dependent stress response